MNPELLRDGCTRPAGDPKGQRNKKMRAHLPILAVIRQSIILGFGAFAQRRVSLRSTRSLPIQSRV
ncbi:MAG: hypothetical protein MZU91_10345 [Desulfosudis oleivorans]|nr:hypothetical protein [Desulfosudis oleivorans]